MAAAARQGVSLRAAIQAGDPTTIKLLVAKNLGIAVLLYSSIVAEIGSGEFGVRRVAGVRHERFFVQRRDLPQRKAVAELTRTVIRAVQRHFPPGRGAARQITK